VTVGLRAVDGVEYGGWSEKIVVVVQALAEFLVVAFRPGPTVGVVVTTDVRSGGCGMEMKGEKKN